MKKELNKYKVIFRSGLELSHIPAVNANQAKIMAQASMISKGHKYAVKSVKKHTKVVAPSKPKVTIHSPKKTIEAKSTDYGGLIIGGIFLLALIASIVYVIYKN